MTVRGAYKILVESTRGVAYAAVPLVTTKTVEYL